MAEISRIQGPGGAPELPGKNRSEGPDSDKFKEELKLKRSQVGETDTEQQKKRKRPEEAEEEEDLEEGTAQGPTAPPAAPFSLGQEDQKINPLDMQSPTGKTSPLASAQPTAAPLGSAAPPPFMVPSTDEVEDDASSQEEDMPPSLASEGESYTPTPYNQNVPQTPYPLGSQETPTFQQTTQAQSEQQKHQDTQKTTSTSSTSKAQGGKTAGPVIGEPTDHVEDKQALLDQLSKKDQKEEAIPPEDVIEGAPPAAVVASLAEIEKKKEPKEIDLDASFAPAAPTVTADTPLTPTPPPAYTSLPPHVLDAFERMAGTMTVMTLSGKTETTITLNSDKFASSRFFGTQIIIQEFSTAPKAFNIQINGSPEAVAIFQGNAEDLMAAFQHGNYNFRVNRLDTGLLADRPVFSRKEKITDKNQDQPGQGSQ